MLSPLKEQRAKAAPSKADGVDLFGEKAPADALPSAEVKGYTKVARQASAQSLAGPPAREAGRPASHGEAVAQQRCDTSGQLSPPVPWTPGLARAGAAEAHSAGSSMELRQSISPQLGPQGRRQTGRLTPVPESPIEQPRGSFRPPLSSTPGQSPYVSTPTSPAAARRGVSGCRQHQSQSRPGSAQPQRLPQSSNVRGQASRASPLGASVPPPPLDRTSMVGSASPAMPMLGPPQAPPLPPPRCASASAVAPQAPAATIWPPSQQVRAPYAHQAEAEITQIAPRTLSRASTAESIATEAPGRSSSMRRFGTEVCCC